MDQIAQTYLRLGSVDNVFRSIPHEIDTRLEILDGLRSDPRYDSLKGDPRWVAVVKYLEAAEAASR